MDFQAIILKNDTNTKIFSVYFMFDSKTEIINSLDSIKRAVSNSDLINSDSKNIDKFTVNIIHRNEIIHSIKLKDLSKTQKAKDLLMEIIIRKKKEYETQKQAALLA